jgi:hypothetical protein
VALVGRYFWCERLTRGRSDLRWLNEAGAAPVALKSGGASDRTEFLFRPQTRYDHEHD